MKIVFVYPMWTGTYTGVTKYFAKKNGVAFPLLNMAVLAAIAQKGGA
jgi:hypothetical protein